MNHEHELDFRSREFRVSEFHLKWKDCEIYWRNLFPASLVHLSTVQVTVLAACSEECVIATKMNTAVDK